MKMKMLKWLNWILPPSLKSKISFRLNIKNRVKQLHPFLIFPIFKIRGVYSYKNLNCPPLALLSWICVPGGEHFFLAFYDKLAIFATKSLTLPYLKSFCIISLIVIFNLQLFSPSCHIFYPGPGLFFSPKSHPKHKVFFDRAKQQRNLQRSFLRGGGRAILAEKIFIFLLYNGVSWCHKKVKHQVPS